MITTHQERPALRVIQLTMIGLRGRNVMNSAMEILRRDFGGDIIEPNAARYQAVSGSLLARGDPAVVLRPARAGDVQAAVRFAGRS
jgi:hypothetical protein